MKFLSLVFFMGALLTHSSLKTAAAGGAGLPAELPLFDRVLKNIKTSGSPTDLRTFFLRFPHLSINSRDAYGNTFLHRMLYAHLPADYVIDSMPFFRHKGFTFAALDGKGQSVLHMAVAFYETDAELTPLINAFVTAGLPIDIPNAQNLTPFQEAFAKRNLEALRALRACGADINHPMPNGQFPLHMALQIPDSEDLVITLVQLGADVNRADPLPHQITGVAGVTPLQCAIENLTDAGVLAIIPHVADINAADAAGRTALHYAVEQFKIEFDPSPDVMQALINAGANVHAVTNVGVSIFAHPPEGYTPNQWEAFINAMVAATPHANPIAGGAAVAADAPLPPAPAGPPVDNPAAEAAGDSREETEIDSGDDDDAS